MYIVGIEERIGFALRVCRCSAAAVPLAGIEVGMTPRHGPSSFSPAAFAREPLVF
jgi:hypothetical protein